MERRKGIWFILVLLLLCFSCCTTVYAADIPSVTGNHDGIELDMERVWGRSETPAQAPSSSGGVQLLSTQSLETQLYDYTVNALRNHKSAYLAGEAEAIRVDYSSFKMPNTNSSAIKVAEALEKAFNNNPELFYVNLGYRLVLYPTTINGTTYAGYVMVAVQGNYTQRQTMISNYNKEKQRMLEMAVPAAQRAGRTKTELALAIHDILASQTVYDNNAANIPDNELYTCYLSYSAYGAIVNKKSVCQGYALAYNDLLKDLGISSYYVVGRAKDGSSSGPHTWNIVQTEQGWYYVDSTWASRARQNSAGHYVHTGAVSHDYFLLTDNELQTLDSYRNTGKNIAGITANTVSHKNKAFWQGVDAALYFYNNKWFYSDARYLRDGDQDGTLWQTSYGTQKNPVKILDFAYLPVRDGNRLYFAKYDFAGDIYNTGYRTAYDSQLYVYDMATGKLGGIRSWPQAGYFIADLFPLSSGTLACTQRSLANSNTAITKSYAIRASDIEWGAIVLDQHSLKVNSAKSVTVNANLMSTTGTIKWKASPANVVKLTPNANGTSCQVQGLGVDSTPVTVTAYMSDTVRASCMATITPMPQSIAFRSAPDEIPINTTKIFLIQCVPSNADIYNVTWTSSNPSIAEITSIGDNGSAYVRANQSGEVTITAKTTNGKTVSKKVACGVFASSMTLSPSQGNLNPGQTLKLNAQLYPVNARPETIAWESTNTRVATVDQSGNVTAVAAGTAVIYASVSRLSLTAGCTVTVIPVAVTGVALDKTTAAVGIGSTLTLKATVAPANASNKTVTWTSSNTNVATVSAGGVVSGKAAGTANITVKTADGRKTAVCKVTVAATPVTGVTLDKTTAAVNIGSTLTLKATVAPANATNKTVTWTSSNTGVATVSTTGVVTGKAAGTANITVKTADGSKTAVCKVTVTTIPVTGVTLNHAAANMSVNGTLTLTATVSPTNATNKAVTWNSSNTSVATVSAAGLVTAKAAGTANITVKTTDSSKTAVCKITVAVSVASVALNKTAATVNQSSTLQLTATVAPSDASNKAVTWTSSNTNVATISATGLVTGKGRGTATITVKTGDGGKTATCALTVNAPVTGVTLNRTSATVGQGKTVSLTATVAPSDALNKNVTWSTSNANVASVSSTGVVTGIANGTATITAKTVENSKTATCKITISEKTTWTASTDFSSVNGANNWSYSQWNGSYSTALSWDRVNQRFQGHPSYAIVGFDWQHPMLGIYSVRTWTAPRSGIVDITSYVQRPNAGGDGVEVMFQKNSTVINIRTINGNQTSRYAFDMKNIPVNQGEVIHFIVSARNNSDYDTVTWDPTIKLRAVDPNRTRWQASTDFSVIQNTNNWSYYEWNGYDIKTAADRSANLRAMSWDNRNLWQAGVTPTCYVGATWQHPSPSRHSMRVWTAPRAGTINITSYAKMEGSGGDGTWVIIQKNGVELSSQRLVGTNTTGFNHNYNNLTVAKGDRVEFVVNRYSNTLYDKVIWDPAIAYK